jgi:hypothetical protein
MKNIVSILTIILLGLTACTKVKKADKQLYIRGRIVLQDLVKGDELSSSKANFPVKLFRKGDSALNYIYSVKTNADGYFVFDIPSRDLDTTYYVSATGAVSSEDFISDTIQVTKNEQKQFEEFQLPLKYNLTNKTYLFLKTKDQQTNSLPYAKVYLYSNPSFAAQNYTAAASYTYTSNQDGEIRAKDITPLIYYANSIASYSTNATYTISSFPIEIKKSLLTKDTLRLQ